MDNNGKLANIPVSDLTRENLEAIKNGRVREHGPSEPVRRKKSNLLLIIVSIILVIGVAVALFFIFRKPADEPGKEDTGDTSAPVEVVWEPSPGSENPGDEYIAHHQETINNPDATSTEKLEAQLSIVNFYTVSEDYATAENLLNEIDRSSLTHRQLFNVYSAYAYLYSTKGDEAAYNEYSALVEEVLNEYWEEEATPETTGEN